MDLIGEASRIPIILEAGPTSSLLTAEHFTEGTGEFRHPDKPSESSQALCHDELFYAGDYIPSLPCAQIVRAECL